MINNLIKKVLDKFVTGYEQNKEELQRNSDILSEEIARVFQSEGRLFIIAVGSTYNVIRGLNFDSNYNFGLPTGILNVLSPGQAVKEFNQDWESIGAIRSAAPVELMAHDLNEKDILIGISSSGTNEFVNGAISFARELNCKTFQISNNSELLNEGSKAEADVNIILPFDNFLQNGLRSLEGSTSMKLIFDTILLNATYLSGRIYKDELIYKRWNSSYSRKLSIEIVQRLTGLSFEESEKLFEESGGAQSKSVLMHKFNISEEEASNILKKNGFNFIKAMGE